MNRITNKNEYPEPYTWEKSLYSLAWYLDGDFHQELKIEPTLSTRMPCLDYALDGGIGKGLYVILSTEQRPKLAFITQLAESFAQQDFGVLFITPERNLSIIAPLILSRQSLLHDFPKSQKIDEIIPLTEKKIENLSDKLLKESRTLLNNMGVIDSVGITMEFLKARIKALQSKHEKLVCFVDGSNLKQTMFLDCLQEYRHLSNDLAIPIIFYSKVPVEDSCDIPRIKGWMDRVSQHVDYTLLLKRNNVNEDFSSILQEKDDFDWILYECQIMPTYFAPETRKCLLSFYSKYGLFHEA